MANHLKKYLIEASTDGCLFGESLWAADYEEAKTLAIARLNEAWETDCDHLDDLGDFAIVTEYTADMHARDAGPELLAALERLLPIAERAFGALTTDIDPARVAIAKAKGETM